MKDRGANPLCGARMRRRGAGATGAPSIALELNIFLKGPGLLLNPLDAPEFHAKQTQAMRSGRQLN
jgi:hypothetical protein